MRLVLFVPLLALVGCASGPFALEARFDEATAARLAAPGPNTITGAALIRQRGGGVVTCAGGAVTLVPVTAYSKEWALYEFGMEASATEGYRAQEAKPYFYKHPASWANTVRTAYCDTQGNFRFENVADGQFYIGAEVKWMVGYVPQGGKIAKIISTGGGRRTEVMLAR